ncbi:protein of unknown function [Candidatus Hydrogenisulfobacillus filiaventi]|uniref:Uncharacterized protein n=1 Tax=Candidatus Hydrogenisulfobacillus filiaventi TaxID=2707344 RepID=A0A6F8ZKI0_9FIRM|nr:protein of unknown function [Candidatus Hydrogenisulfobacillus filiaventi]
MTGAAQGQPAAGSGARRRRAAWAGLFLAGALAAAAGLAWRAGRRAPVVTGARAALAWLAALGPGSPARWAVPGSQAAQLGTYLQRQAAAAAAGPLTLRGGRLEAFRLQGLQFTTGGASLDAAFVWVRELRVRGRPDLLTVRIRGQADLQLVPGPDGWRVVSAGLSFGTPASPLAPDTFSLPALARQGSPPLPQGAPGY